MKPDASSVSRSADFRRFVSFVAIGVLNTGVGYGLYGLFLWIGTPPQTALALAFVLGVLWNYFTHARFVFGTKGYGRLPIYILTYIGIYLCNAAALALLLRAGVGPYLAQALILPFSAALGFLGIGAALMGRLPFRPGPASPDRD